MIVNKAPSAHAVPSPCYGGLSRALPTANADPTPFGIPWPNEQDQVATQPEWLPLSFQTTAKFTPASFGGPETEGWLPRMCDPQLGVQGRLVTTGAYLCSSPSGSRFLRAIPRKPRNGDHIEMTAIPSSGSEAPVYNHPHCASAATSRCFLRLPKSLSSQGFLQPITPPFLFQDNWIVSSSPRCSEAHVFP